MSPRPALPLRIEYVLLGLVRRHPAHGYDLLQRWNADEPLHMIWTFKAGALYAGLEKLEQLGYLQASVEGSSTAPQRKKFAITPTGEQAFLDWMTTPLQAARDFRLDFLARLYFADDIPLADFACLVERQKQVTRGWLARLQAQLPDSQGYARQVIQFRICQVQAILDWLDSLPA
jgi:DNA-binding PadR family transcriptional regulator